jgi:predicted nucleic-acid-binding Zn-ribbon protein
VSATETLISAVGRRRMRQTARMGLFSRSRASAVTATVDDRPVRCAICGGTQFWDREVKLNTTGAEFFDLGWANESGLGLVCLSCGYLHTFVGDVVQLWNAD